MASTDDPEFNPFQAPKSALQPSFEEVPGLESRPDARIRFEAIGTAWELISEQLGTWVLASLITFAANFGINLLIGLPIGIFVGIKQAMNQQAGHNQPEILLLGLQYGGQVVQNFLSTIVYAFFMGGMYHMALLQLKGEPISVGDLFEVGRFFPRLAGAAILKLLASLAGALLLLIPAGILVVVAVLPSLRQGGQPAPLPLVLALVSGLLAVIPALVISALLMFTYPLIVHGRLGVIEAMGRSWSALKGQFIMASLFQFVAYLVAGLGVLACCVGVLFTMPLYPLAVAVLYRDFFLGGPVKLAPGYPAAPPLSDLPPDSDWYHS